MNIAQLNERDNKLISLYDRYTKAVIENTKDRLQYAFFKGSQWPHKEALSKADLERSTKDKEEKLKELVAFSNGVIE